MSAPAELAEGAPPAAEGAPSPVGLLFAPAPPFVHEDGCGGLVIHAALRRGDTAPAVLNAANEIGVQAFLNRRIKFLEIAKLVEETLDAAERQGAISAAQCLDDILSIDERARRLAEDALNRY